MEPRPTELRVLIMRREDWWVAQCLEFDIAAQAQGTIDDIKAELCRTITVRLAACKAEGINPFKLPPAPKLYHELFNRARLKVIDEESDLPPAFMIDGFLKPEMRCQF